MARPKKTTIRKQVAKKATTRKTTAKTGTAGIKLLSATAKPGVAGSKISKRTANMPSAKTTNTRRPPNNPDVPQATIDNLNTILNELKNLLDDYAQHLRALDRKRLNGVGVKKLGFIERAYEISLENAEYMPHYLTVDRFGTDIQYFMDFRSLVDLTDQIREKLWNITIQSSDIAYTDALEFYASVREAAKRRVDAAETIFHELSGFFHRSRLATEDGETPTTEKKAKRDFNALLHGRHDGKLVIENIKPKLTGGKRKIIDESFKDTAQFKETEEGEIKE